MPLPICKLWHSNVERNLLCLFRLLSWSVSPSLRISYLYFVRAPEVLLGCPKYSCPLDVWSLGTIFAEMLNRKPLFQVVDPPQFAVRLTKPSGRFWDWSVIPDLPRAPDSNWANLAWSHIFPRFQGFPAFDLRLNVTVMSTVSTCSKWRNFLAVDLSNVEHLQPERVHEEERWQQGSRFAGANACLWPKVWYSIPPSKLNPISIAKGSLLKEHFCIPTSTAWTRRHFPRSQENIRSSGSIPRRFPLSQKPIPVLFQSRRK